ncbi:MAG: hypothetical protein ACOCTI_00740 [Phycisphaeraceae bacterium]
MAAPLPPYSPEFNPVERVRGYLRQHHLSSRVYADEDALWEADCRAWKCLSPKRLQSLCHSEWVMHERRPSSVSGGVAGS